MKADWPLKKSMGLAAMGSLFVGVLAKAAHAFLFRYDFIAKNIPHFGLVEIFYAAVFLFIVLVMGFLMPQRYLRKASLSPLQYGTTMILLLMMLGVVLKMAARLGFNIKYLFSLPGLNLNI
ncbi:MAG: hypothetical protein IPP35_11045 [Elusimicrobia bacterium]|nr:hypothetical protein [Elusimicrobiota bacterium]